LNIATPSRVCYHCNIFLALEAGDRKFLKTLSMRELHEFLIKHLHINIYQQHLFEKDEIIDYIIIHYAEQCRKSTVKEHPTTTTTTTTTTSHSSINSTNTNVYSPSRTSTNSCDFDFGGTSVESSTNSSQSVNPPQININFGTVGQILFSFNSSLHPSSQEQEQQRPQQRQSQSQQESMTTSVPPVMSTTPNETNSNINNENENRFFVSDSETRPSINESNNNTNNLNPTQSMGSSYSSPNKLQNCELDLLPISELKAILKRHNIDYSDCVEKRDLVEKIKHFVGEDKPPNPISQG
jgi:hypothetical protein